MSVIHRKKRKRKINYFKRDIQDRTKKGKGKRDKKGERKRDVYGYNRIVSLYKKKTRDLRLGVTFNTLEILYTVKIQRIPVQITITNT